MKSGSVIGIDIGCSPVRRSSAICRLDWSETEIVWTIRRFRTVEPERQEAIAALCGGQPVLAAALDGPLQPGFGIIGRYRTAERMLTRRLRPLIGKPGQSSAPVGKLLNFHANACALHLLQLSALLPATHAVRIDDSAVAEAFPSAFLGLMIEDPAALSARRGDRSDVFFRHLAESGGLDALLRHCLPGRSPSAAFSGVAHHDDRAALVCALTALCLARGDFVAVGDDDGWIILPPRRLIRPAQWALLEANAAEAPGAPLHVAEPARP